MLVIQPNVIAKDAKAGAQLGNSFVITDDGLENLQHYSSRLIRCR